MAENWKFGGVGGIELQGLTALNIKMGKVGQVVADKLNRRALKKALTPIAVVARRNAPTGDPTKDPLAGMLADSIQEIISKKKGVVRGVVGPTRRRIRIGTIKSGKNKGKPIYKDPLRYAHLQEFGTSHSLPHPFMRLAWQQEGAEKALAVYQEQLNTDLDREINKIAASS